MLWYNLAVRTRTHNRGADCEAEDPIDMPDETAVIRAGFFLGILLLMALWEAFAPRRGRRRARGARWTENLGLVLIDALVVRLLLPGAAVSVALLADAHGWGLLHWHALPEPAAFVLGVVLLDLVVYLQHVMFHAVPVLWRIHMVHHTDVDFDTTTGVRFHPVEIVLSMLLKMAAVAALGPPAGAVVAFEVLLNATALFNHGNVRLPARLDRILRAFVVTPEMHRVHHSVIPRETNSNFGFNLPWWDRLFGTYRAQPTAGHEAMTIGLSQFQDPPPTGLGRLLALPATGAPGAYPLNRGAPTL